MVWQRKSFLLVHKSPYHSTQAQPKYTNKSLYAYADLSLSKAQISNLFISEGDTVFADSGQTNMC